MHMVIHPVHSASIYPYTLSELSQPCETGWWSFKLKMCCLHAYETEWCMYLWKIKWIKTQMKKYITLLWIWLFVNFVCHGGTVQIADGYKAPMYCSVFKLGMYLIKQSCTCLKNFLVNLSTKCARVLWFLKCHKVSWTRGYSSRSLKEKWRPAPWQLAAGYSQARTTWRVNRHFHVHEITPRLPVETNHCRIAH